MGNNFFFEKTGTGYAVHDYELEQHLKTGNARFREWELESALKKLCENERRKISYEIVKRTFSLTQTNEINEGDLEKALQGNDSKRGHELRLYAEKYDSQRNMNRFQQAMCNSNPNDLKRVWIFWAEVACFEANPVLALKACFKDGPKEAELSDWIVILNCYYKITNQRHKIIKIS